MRANRNQRSGSVFQSTHLEICDAISTLRLKLLVPGVSLYGVQWGKGFLYNGASIALEILMRTFQPIHFFIKNHNSSGFTPKI